MGILTIYNKVIIIMRELEIFKQDTYIEVINAPIKEGDKVSYVTLTLAINSRDVFKTGEGVRIHGINGSFLDLPYKGTKIDDYDCKSVDELYDWFKENSFSSGAGSGSGSGNTSGVKGITGDLVNNADPKNPIINFPNDYRQGGENSGFATQGTWTNFNFIFDKKNGVPKFDLNSVGTMGEIGRVDGENGEIGFSYFKNVKVPISANPSTGVIEGEIRIYDDGNITSVKGGIETSIQLPEIPVGDDPVFLGFAKERVNGRRVLEYRGITASDLFTETTAPVSFLINSTSGGNSRLDSMELAMNPDGDAIVKEFSIPFYDKGGLIVTTTSNADNSVVNRKALNTALDARVSNFVTKVSGKQLSTEDFTTAEKTKLANLESSHFRGRYESKVEVDKVVGRSGDYAFVVVDDKLENFIWDAKLNIWKPSVDTETAETPVSVKQKYESNANTNAFTDTEKTKLNSLTNFDITTLNPKFDTKVDKVAGKVLSTNDYTTAEKTKLGGLSNYNDTAIKEDISKKVDKVIGKDLSSNDFTDTYKTKLENISESVLPTGSTGQLIGFDGSNNPTSKRIGWEEFLTVKPTTKKTIFGFKEEGGEYINDEIPISTDGNGLPTPIVDGIPVYDKDKTIFSETSENPKSVVNNERLDSKLSNKVDKIAGKKLSTEDFTTAEKTKLQTLKNYDESGVQTALSYKVDKVNGKGLSTEDFTSELKDKLANLEGSHFRGRYESKADVDKVIGKSGDYAFVVVDGKLENFIWDAQLSEWKLSVDTGASTETGASIKQKYESNPDTNAFTDTNKSKLAGIAVGATQNQSDTYLRNRANHTGTQAISTIMGLQIELNKIMALPDADTDLRMVPFRLPTKDGNTWDKTPLYDNVDQIKPLKDGLITWEGIKRYLDGFHHIKRYKQEGDVSASKSSMTVPIGYEGYVDLIITNTSTTGVRVELQVNKACRLDFKACSIYDSGVDGVIYGDDRTFVGADRFTFDSLVFSQSREVSNHLIRINDDLYNFRYFISGRGARTTVWIDEI